MNVKATSQAEREGRSEGANGITLGVDIIELVSSSMYLEPLTAYREYVQNAADAIDDARDLGLAAGRIEITVEPTERYICIRDDGIGIPSRLFVRRLSAFGGSAKRRQERRGFRGVGRLSGLGYCQELIFRSQAEDEMTVSELRWDGRILRSILRSGDFSGTLADAVAQMTTYRKYPAPKAERFFEVELRGIVRHGRDDLLNEVVVSQYLSEVAPVPFAPSFRYADVLNGFLDNKGVGSDARIYVNDTGPLYRPHSNSIRIRQGVLSTIAVPELFEVAGIDGAPAACGWVLHHDYSGAIPRMEAVRGLRLRSGNLQIGGDDTLVDLFPEPRFNAWAVAEVHLLDRRIVPNGRRDQCEPSVHYANVLNNLAPRARELAARCRKRSKQRQILRNVKLQEERIRRELAIMQQGAITEAARANRVAQADSSLSQIQRAAESTSFSLEERAELEVRWRKLHTELEKAALIEQRAKPLEHFEAERRRAYEEVFSLIYESASDTRVAKDIVEGVLGRLS